MRRAHALHPSLAYERYRFLYVALRNGCTYMTGDADHQAMGRTIGFERRHTHTSSHSSIFRSLSHLRVNIHFITYIHTLMHAHAANQHNTKPPNPSPPLSLPSRGELKNASHNESLATRQRHPFPTGADPSARKKNHASAKNQHEVTTASSLT